MGIELPPELAEVAAQTGVKWPEADEDAMGRSAQAWRDAATSMSTLTTDADTTARSTLATVTGPAAEAASTEWKRFVEPDSGHLTSVVRGCTDAADRLEHASSQVGQAKVEIVRNLVALAQNQDAVNTAAATGHPFALASLDTAVQGTAVNVAHIESQLVSAVQPGTGVDLAGHQNVVNANPGTHLLAGVTTGVGELPATVTDQVAPGVTTLAGETVQGGADPANAANLTGGTTHGAADTLHRGTDFAANTAAGLTGTGATNAVGDTLHQTADLAGAAVDEVTDLTEDPTHGATSLTGGTSAHGATSLTHGPTNLVGDVVGAATDLVDDTAHGATGLAHGPGNLVGDIAGGPVDVGHGPGNLVGDTVHGAADLVGNAVHGHPGDVMPGDVMPGHPADLHPGQDADITGPVPIDNLPTPPTGQTYQAGFAGGLEPSAVPTNLPPAAPPAPGPIAPPAYGGAPNLAGGPGFGAPAFGAAPVAPGAPAIPGAPIPAAPPPGVPAPRPAVPAAPGYTTATPDRPAQDQPAPRKQLAGPPGAPPPSRGETDQALAAFWIHMFPIGHLPVASYRPARQLPPPHEELDYAAGLRFEPADHPRFDLVDGSARIAEVNAAIATRAAEIARVSQAPVAYPTGPPTAAPDAKTVPNLKPVQPGPALPADNPAVAPLLDGHDPLGGGHERDWDRRYLVRLGSVTAQGISPDGLEYNWPTSEQYPEGGSAPGEPEVLDAGTVIDRFGGPGGRVFAEDRTPFAQRSLPPAHKDAGYRRYEVRKPLPVWRAVSAAWFGQPGGGIRYRTTHSATELVALGYLEELL